MEVMSHRSSSALNPNAPLFVPWAYRTVEDFSEEWWELVQSSAWFREYWLQECFEDPEDDLESFDDLDSFLPEIVSDGYKQEEDKERKDVVSLASLKWAEARVLPESPKYFEKAPKIVKMKVSPRTIHQPK